MNKPYLDPATVEKWTPIIEIVVSLVVAFWVLQFAAMVYVSFRQRK